MKPFLKFFYRAIAMLCIATAGLHAQTPIGSLEVQKSVKLGTNLTLGTISPSALTADTDDWAPTNFATAFAIRVSTDASHNLTGIASGAAGRVITLENVGSFPLVLKNAGSGSTAANRFALSADYTLTAGSGLFLKYDGTSSRWRMVGNQNGSTGTGDVVGPSSATNGAVARFDTTTGKLLKNSPVPLSDTGAFTFPAGVTQTFAPDATNAGLNVGSYAGVPSSLSNGDVFYDSVDAALKARINGVTVALGAGGGTPGGSDTQVQYNSGGTTFAGSPNFTYVSGVLGLINALSANTSGDGFTLSNTTAATSGNQRYSPRIVLDGQGWKTTATAASQDVRFSQEVRPVQGTTNPTGNFVISSNINGGSYTDRFTVDSAGTAYLGDTSAAKMSSASGNLTLAAQGTNQNVNITPSGTGQVVSDKGSGSLPALISSGTNFRLSSADADGVRMEFIGYGATVGGLNARAIGGTRASPTVTTDGRFAFAFQSFGYDGSYTTGANGLMGIMADGNWSGSNHGMFVTVQATLTGTTTMVEMARFYGNRLAIIPSTASTSTTTGSLVNAGGFGNAGALWNGGLLNVAGDLQLSKTITSSGTTGAATINKNSGSVRFAAAATSLVLTNSLITANSVIQCTVGSNDTTLKSVAAVTTSGSATLYANSAATAETIVYFTVTN